MEKFKETVMIEFMKAVLNSSDRMNDYIEDEDIFSSISEDAKKMADAMYKRYGKVKK